MTLPALITPVALVAPIARLTVPPFAAIAPASAAPTPATTTPAFVPGLSAGGSAAGLFALARRKLAALITRIVETAPALRLRSIGRALESITVMPAGTGPLAFERRAAIHRGRRTGRLAIASFAVPTAPTATTATPTTAPALPSLAPIAPLSPAVRAAFLAGFRMRNAGALAIAGLELTRVRLALA